MNNFNRTGVIDKTKLNLQYFESVQHLGKQIRLDSLNDPTVIKVLFSKFNSQKKIQLPTENFTGIINSLVEAGFNFTNLAVVRPTKRE